MSVINKSKKKEYQKVVSVSYIISFLEKLFYKIKLDLEMWVIEYYEEIVYLVKFKDNYEITYRAINRMKTFSVKYSWFIKK